MTEFALGLVIGLSVCATPKLEGQRVNDDVVKSPKPPYDMRNQHCSGGTVTAVNKGSITVKGGEIVDGARNPPIFTVPTLTFRVSEVLAEGRVDRDARGADSYRLGDLKVGDKVDLQYGRKNGISTCTRISILRRPGGKVPPAQDLPTEGWQIAHHDRMNAFQDWEERRIPVPEKFRLRTLEEAIKELHTPKFTPIPVAKP